MKPLIKRNQKWAIIFGNHDDLSSGEGGTREDLMRFDLSLDGSLSQFGPSDLPGVSNYYLEILESQDSSVVKTILWFLDSNDMCEGGPAGFAGCFHPSQVNWFLQQSQILQSKHGDLKTAIAFFHIPLPEHLALFNFNATNGWMNESTINCQTFNSGLFAAFRAINYVKLATVGHNHGCDFCGDYYGVKLCFGRHSGYGGYG